MMRLSPATIGEERPLGADTFHLTFLSGPNSTGGFALSATPDPFGPRNRGHASAFSAASPTVANTFANTNTINSFMASSRLLLLLRGISCTLLLFVWFQF